MISRSTRHLARHLHQPPSSCRATTTTGAASPRTWTRTPTRCFQTSLSRHNTQTTKSDNGNGNGNDNSSNNKSSSRSSRSAPRITLAAAASALTVAIGFSQLQPRRRETPDHSTPLSQDNREPPNLPRYRLEEVRKHDAKSKRPWVIRQDKVYDITDWVPAHPGGDVILRAAGGSIDPYWDIFAIHKTQYVYDILAQYHIGFIDSADLIDGLPAREHIEDPFADDPERHPHLITKTAKPRNAETPGNALAESFLTPNDLFYVRNHMWVPRIAGDADTQHTLTVELTDGTIKEYTLGDLKAKFPRRKVTAALQCSGNRRKDMSEGSGRKANGLEWKTGAISNACWEGVYLSDLLTDAGFDVKEGLAGSAEAKHVQFSGIEAYGASIPIKKAIDPQGDVLLAYAMNGEPLPRDHGFPLRAVVPGHVAARSVKWLNRIVLSDEESTTQWQRRDYKCFGPNETKVDWDAAPSIQELPVQSAITTCRLGEWSKEPVKSGDINNNNNNNSSSSSNNNKEELTKARHVSATGYAYSGGGRNIIRVDISADDGKTWSQANLLPDCVSKDGKPSPCFGHGTWSWKRWVYDGKISLDSFTLPSDEDDDENCPEKIKAEKKRCTNLVVKATDDSYNTQPESHAATWNVRGNLATAWHRVKVCSECSGIKQKEIPEKPKREVSK